MRVRLVMRHHPLWGKQPRSNACIPGLMYLEGFDRLSGFPGSKGWWRHESPCRSQDCDACLAKLPAGTWWTVKKDVAWTRYAYADDFAQAVINPADKRKSQPF